MTRTRALSSLVAAACSIALVSCAGAPRQRPVKAGPAGTGPGSLAAARAYLEGRWTLLSYEIFPASGEPVRLQGTGLLTYDGFGNLDMEIRVDEQTAGLLARAGIATDGGVLSTKGRTVIDTQNRTLTYVLEGQPPATAPPGPLAMQRPRHWQVDGDVLTLTTKDEAGRPLAVGRWQKTP